MSGTFLLCRHMAPVFGVLFALFGASCLPCDRLAMAADVAAAEVVRDIVFVQHGDERLAFDAYLQSGPGPHPAVVFVHGGGFVTGDKFPCPAYILDPFFQAGYSVFSVNYRVAPKHPFPAATDDVAAAVRFIKQHADEYRIDPQRMALTGESAGGLLSAFVGATLKGDDRPAAVIPMFGEVDLELRVSEDPCHVDGRSIPKPAGGCISGGLAAFLGFDAITTDAQRARVREASTISHIYPEMPPYLLVHGTRDFGVPYEQSVSLHQAMTKVGADCTLLPVVGGGHGGWPPEERHEVNEAMLKWLASRLEHVQ